MKIKFSELKLSHEILRALDEKGYVNPTPIQEKCIPIALERRDILGCAQTGTGKTAAFSLPIINLIHNIEGNNPNSHLRALIITPTRELAIQIHENLEAYGKYTPLRFEVIFGGVKQGKQVASLKRGVSVLVATPGRLIDLMNQGYVSLDSIKLFVLDEADRMLDMGFINDIKKVIKALPQKKQSLFFSATMPNSIKQLSKTILHNPTFIEVAPPSSTAEKVKQELYYTNKKTKRSLLLHILKEKEIDSCLVFTRTKYGADKLSRFLHKSGVKSLAIHGNKSQPQRQKALRQFKENTINVLVATDIAARGIDINELKFVINYEISNIAETYVHRIGRSGRAGKSGIAISICEPEENAYVKQIERLTGQKIPVVSDHPFPQTEKPMTEAELKEQRREKEKKKQEFFANRKKKRNPREKNQSRDKPKSKSSKAQKENKLKRNQKKQSSNEGGNNTTNPKKPSNTPKRKKKPQKSRRRKSTDMSPKLKGKFMWPLE